MNAYIDIIKNNLKLWLEEIRTSRKAQLILVCAPLLVWLLWPASANIVSKTSNTEKAIISSQQFQEFKKLPDLSLFNNSNELPKEREVCRDLFLFEESKPLPVDNYPPVPSPLTAKELEAERLLLVREQEMRSWPDNFMYLGYLGTKSSGILGAFSYGEDTITIRQGELFHNHWRLVRLTGKLAEFQNLKFSDLWQKVNILDSQGEDGDGSARYNNF